MSSGSLIYKLIPFILFFFILSYALSPSEAETEIIIDNNKNFINTIPIKKFMILTVTGYSSSFDETDSNPWLTAYNTLAKDGIVASNILPFGTKIKIPQLFGDKIFIVEDKMNSRYDEHIDIWFPTKSEALDFGIHYNVLVEILE